MTRSEFDADSRYNGQPLVECPECRQLAAPRGRDGGVAASFCDCRHGPDRGDLWPDTTREDFGFPRDLAAESARLRAKFYPDDDSDECGESSDDDEPEWTGPDLLEHMALNGECPGAEILRLRARAAEIESVWRKNYGNSMGLHLDMLGLLGSPDQGEKEKSNG
jgi:hypothetical protein